MTVTWCAACTNAACTARVEQTTAAVDGNVTDRCNVRPITGSVPTAIPISRTRGQRSCIGQTPCPTVMTSMTRPSRDECRDARPYQHPITTIHRAVDQEKRAARSEELESPTF